jgi:hypothetical protein
MESVYIGCLEPPSGADDAPLGMCADSARFLRIPGLSEFPAAKSAAFGSNDPKAATPTGSGSIRAKAYSRH